MQGVTGRGMLRSVPGRPPFLGVEHSVTGRCWQGLTPRQDRLSLQIAQRCDVPTVLARALARRNLQPEEVAAYLDPQRIDPAASRHDLTDLDRTAERLVAAVCNRQTIALVASTGIDGCCALIMMQTMLEAMAPAGRRSTVRQAAKLTTTHPVRDLADDHDLIVMLDLGSGHAVPAGGDWPCDVILIDNDASDPALPDVYAYLNGNRHDDPGHYGDLCTAGLVYLLIQVITERLSAVRLPQPDLSPLTQYVCLAVAAERVPLNTNNRPIVLEGLAQIRQRDHPGFKSLVDTVPIRHRVRFHDLRTGLCSRLVYGEGPEQAPLTSQLLRATRPHEAARVAAVLDQFHADGLPASDGCTIEARELAIQRHPVRGLVWAAGRNWPVSQLERIAAALQDDMNWPALALRLDADKAIGVAIGVPGFDLGTAIVNCRAGGLAIRGGGHPMKAVIEMPLGEVSGTVEALGADLAAQNPRHEPRHDVRLDGIVLPTAVNVRMARSLDRAGPFGIGSPRPRYVLTHQQILKRQKYSTESLRIEMCGRAHAPIDGYLPGGYTSELGTFLRQCGRAPVHLAGTITMARSGHRARFIIEDAART